MITPYNGNRTLLANNVSHFVVTRTQTGDNAFKRQEMDQSMLEK